MKIKKWNACSNRLVTILLLLVLSTIFVSNYAFAANIEKQISIGSPAVNTSLTKTKKPVSETDSRLLVRFKNGVSQLTKHRLHQALGAVVTKNHKSVTDLQVIEVAAGKNPKQLAEQYRKDPNVLYVEPDFKIRLRVIPNDSQFSNLWGMHNTGQTGGVADADINAPEAWDITQGSSSVVVAVVDTGVDYTHQDLAANIWTNPGEIPNNGIDDDNNGYTDDVHGIDSADNDSDPMDTEGHGTHVAGTIGARGNNGVGVAGVNWNVSIIACKVFASSTGQDINAFVSDAVECLDYIRDLKVNRGVNIVATNNSWGWIGPPSQTLMDAIQRQLDAGILFVASAGNDTLNTDEFLDNPASYYIPNIISVAASTDLDTLAGFSNWGERTVHVAAPGESILSTVPSNNYQNFSGTSMASPHVVGLAALLKSQFPSYNYNQLRNLIISSGTPLAAFNNTTVSGRRIRAYDTDNTGGLSCVDQNVLARLQPANDTVGLASGSSIGVSVLNINCAESAANNVKVTILDTGQNVTLLDNGVGYDQVAGDGIFSSEINLEALSLQSATIAFPDSTSVYARNVYSYLSAVANNYQWRDISATGVPVFTGNTPGTPYDDETRYINTPFQIPFANTIIPYNRLAVDSNGYIVMQRVGDDVLNFSVFENFEIPSLGFSNLVAVFWDDLVLDNTSGSNVYWGVLGSAPDRELVITWQNVRAFGGSPGMTFQVVFSESSADVIVNYQDTITPNSFVNNGIGATAGIQVAPNVGTQYSYNSPSLTSGSSIRWVMPAGVENLPETPSNNYPPTANAGEDQVVNEGDVVFLNGSGTDIDGDIVAYNWSQISGDPVAITGVNTANPSFIAPQVNSSTELIFELTVTDNGGASGSDQIVVVVNDITVVNIPPTANAGPDQSVDEGETVNLNGTGTDIDGNIVSYNWTQIIGQRVSFNSSIPNPGFTAPQVNIDTNLVFELTVTDNNGATDTDQVTITVNDVPPVNIPPVANAGADQNVDEGDEVTLNGSGTDIDGTITSYSWNQISGVPVTLSNSNVPNPTFTAPQVDADMALSFQLTVTDNAGDSSVDQVIVIVSDVPTNSEKPSDNGSFGRDGSGGGGSFGILFALLLQLIAFGRLRAWRLK